ncbi:MAG: YraN family protein [Clostridium sp.]|uniref:YraN family protein n=1 Tax=Clostridium sp. TaxID=1506 RepID=UPI00399A2C94
MHSYNKDIGSFGEALAKDYLISKGYKILNMNFRNKFGEIDIICKKNNLLIFCEIKSRYSNSFGSPIESITCYKQKQIIKLSELYLISKKYYNFNVRYDIIEVIFNTITSSHIINHVQDAFRAY